MAITVSSVGNEIRIINLEEVHGGGGEGGRGEEKRTIILPLRLGHRQLITPPLEN